MYFGEAIWEVSSRAVNDPIEFELLRFAVKPLNEWNKLRNFNHF